MCRTPSTSNRQPSFAASVSTPSVPVGDLVASLQRHERVAEVQQVEPDDQQPVDGGRHARVVGEDLLEEDLPVLEQGAREPDGEPDAGLA